MNIPYLLKVLGTEKLSELVANIDLLPLDMNLAIWDSIDKGEIELDEKLDKITVLVEATASSDPEMSNKILRVIQHYAKNGSNVTRGRLNSYVKDPMTGTGYPWHEYVMAAQHLLDDGKIVEEVVEVMKAKKRPAHTFVFLGLPENDNPEMNAKAVNKWIDDFAKSTVK